MGCNLLQMHIKLHLTVGLVFIHHATFLAYENADYKILKLYLHDSQMVEYHYLTYRATSSAVESRHYLRLGGAKILWTWPKKYDLFNFRKLIAILFRSAQSIILVNSSCIARYS